MKKLPLPSLNALRVFEAAGRLGSFSVAAEELLVTQSAVSRQIILLEDELGCSLFSRSRSGVTLSTYGREYHARVSRSLLEVSDATEAIKLKRAGLNILRVTTLPTLASHWLIPRLLDFKKRHPGIAVDVSCSNMLEDLTTNAFQVGIRLGTGHWDGLNATPLFGEELVSVCAPKVVREDNADIRKLLSETPLLQTTTRPDAWPQWLEEHGFEKTDVSENLIGFQDFFITLQAAILGHGLALIPSFLVQRELSEGLLVDPTKLRISSDRQYYFVCSADSMESQPVTHFRNWMLSQDPLMA